METFLFVAHIILSFLIIVSILMQSGDGGGMGAGFGGAAAVGQEIFGGRGAATFLGKFTVFLGASFMVTSMALAWFSSKPQSVLDLGQGSGMASQAQVHQIIEQGSGPMPGQAMPDDSAGMEIPPEIMEQLQQQIQDGGGELELEGLDPVEEPAGEAEAPALQEEQVEEPSGEAEAPALQEEQVVEPSGEAEAPALQEEQVEEPSGEAEAPALQEEQVEEPLEEAEGAGDE